jgi:hypothetical protein
MNDKRSQFTRTKRIRLCSLVLAVLIGVPLFADAALAQAQGMFVYPARGQSQAQQQRDSYECHSWATRQTGFDPTRSAPAAMPPPPPTTQYQPSRRHVVRGAGGGAALGAVGGAIAGDAGKGAAAGAAMGAMVGGVRRRRERISHYEQQQQMQQQYAQQQTAHQAAQQNQYAVYQRAVAACLQGRGYTVN